MATLSKHGQTIGILEYTSYRKAYCADGTILKDSGSGWKVAGKVKVGFTIQEAFNNAKAKLEDKERRLPAYALYKKLLYKYVPKTHRWMVNTAISMMPDDADGVWSSINGHGDYRFSIDLDECVELCRAYSQALIESRQ